jgi:hypothetical protein
MFGELEKRFKPKGSAVFQELDRRYTSLALDQCSGVMNFAERLREAQSELLQLDETCKIGAPQFINMFLTGLGPEYEVFLTAFYQKSQLTTRTRLQWRNNKTCGHIRSLSCRR